MKGNEGVTILQIVITIIVMMLILSASVFYGVNTTKEEIKKYLYKIEQDYKIVTDNLLKFIRI